MEGWKDGFRVCVVRIADCTEDTKGADFKTSGHHGMGNELPYYRSGKPFARILNGLRLTCTKTLCTQAFIIILQFLRKHGIITTDVKSIIEARE